MIRVWIRAFGAACLLWMYTTCWDDWKTAAQYESIKKELQSLLNTSTPTAASFENTQDARILCRLIDVYEKKGWTEMSDHLFQEGMIRYERMTEKEHLDFLMTLNQYRAFDRRYELWLLNHLEDHLPGDPMILARKALLEFEEEKNITLSFTERRRALTILESMLLLEERPIK